jgi:hypothetical protein
LKRRLEKRINPRITKYTLILQFVSGQPALQTLDVRDPNLKPSKLDSPVLHTSPEQDSALIHTPPEKDLAVIHTPPEKDSALIHTTPEQDLLLGRSLVDAASVVSTSIICNFLTDHSL